ncbi:MAG TPA: TIGR03086 family metal-binding protein [Acidimicrobiales bacterium]
MADVIGLYRRAVEEFGARVRTVSADQWSLPTPAAEWDVRALVNHVLNENQWVPPLLEGLTIAEVGDRFEGDQLGADPWSSWTDVAVAALAACQDDDVPLRVVHVSFGDITGEDYLAQVTTDHVVHTWDLARATGGDEHLDAELVDFALGYLEPQAEAWRGAGAFGPAVKVHPGADRQTELLALTGRDPLGTGELADVVAAAEEAGEESGVDQLTTHLALLAGQARTIQGELDSYLTTRSQYWDNKAEEWAADLRRYDRVIVGMAHMLGYEIPPEPPQGAQRRLSREERASIQEFLESHDIDLGRTKPT